MIVGGYGKKRIVEGCPAAVSSCVYGDLDQVLGIAVIVDGDDVEKCILGISALLQFVAGQDHAVGFLHVYDDLARIILRVRIPVGLGDQLHLERSEVLVIAGNGYGQADRLCVFGRERNAAVG